MYQHPYKSNIQQKRIKQDSFCMEDKYWPEKSDKDDGGGGGGGGDQHIYRRELRFSGLLRRE